MDAPCLHCEARPAANVRGLCADCCRCRGIRRLYRRGHHWTPQWEAHLRRLTRRARLRLPLFDEADRPA